MQRLLVFLVLFCAPAFAQSTYQVVSSFNKPGQPVRQECLDQVAELRRQVEAYPHPARWTYVVACDDAQWPLVLAHIGYAPPRNARVYGMTDLAEGLSIFRGRTLLNPEPRTVTSEIVVAHELAHIYLHSRDEDTVERQAQIWLKLHGKPTLAVAEAALPPRNSSQP